MFTFYHPPPWRASKFLKRECSKRGAAHAQRTTAKHSVSERAVVDRQLLLTIYKQGDPAALTAQSQRILCPQTPVEIALRQSLEAEVVFHQHQLSVVPKTAGIASHRTLCAGDPEKAKQYAKIEFEISHYRDGVWGAQVVAAAISAAMVDGTMDEILEAAMSAIPEESWLYHNMTGAFKILEERGSLLAAWMDLHDYLWTSSWATTAEAIPSAFVCLKAVNGDFRTGVTVAGNFGRDADTIGAVAGVILGAKYGASQMPAHWIEKTRFPTGTCLNFTKGIDIREYAEQITDIMIEG